MIIIGTFSRGQWVNDRWKTDWHVMPFGIMGLGSGNGFLPDCTKPILPDQTPRNIFQWNMIEHQNIFIQWDIFKNVVCKMFLLSPQVATHLELKVEYSRKFHPVPWGGSVLCVTWLPLQYKTIFPDMGISIINDKTPVILSYYIYNWNPYIGKTASLYCNSHLVMSTHNIDDEKKKKMMKETHVLVFHEEVFQQPAPCPEMIENAKK